MFKIKASSETIEISPFWVVSKPLCRMIEQSAGHRWPGIPPQQNTRRKRLHCDMPSGAGSKSFADWNL
jgi:hypothetical protein